MGVEVGLAESALLLGRYAHVCNRLDHIPLHSPIDRERFLEF